MATPVKPKRIRAWDILWRKPDEWVEIATWLTDDYVPIQILVEWRGPEHGREISIVEIYRMGDRYVYNRPLTFTTEHVEAKNQWRRFAVIRK